MISLVESFLFPDKQGTPEEGQRIQQPKCCVSTNNNKDEDNSLKNYSQNKTHQASLQNFRQIKRRQYQKPDSKSRVGNNFLFVGHIGTSGKTCWPYWNFWKNLLAILELLENLVGHIGTYQAKIYWIVLVLVGTFFFLNQFKCFICTVMLKVIQTNKLEKIISISHTTFKAG